MMKYNEVKLGGMGDTRAINLNCGGRYVRVEVHVGIWE